MFNAYVYTCRMYIICGQDLWIIIVVHRLLIDNDCIGDYTFVFLHHHRQHQQQQQNKKHNYEPLRIHD